MTQFLANSMEQYYKNFIFLQEAMSTDVCKDTHGFQFFNLLMWGENQLPRKKLNKIGECLPLIGATYGITKVTKAVQLGMSILYMARTCQQSCFYSWKYHQTLMFNVRPTLKFHFRQKLAAFT